MRNLLKIALKHKIQSQRLILCKSLAIFLAVVFLEQLSYLFYWVGENTAVRAFQMNENPLI